MIWLKLMMSGTFSLTVCVNARFCRMPYLHMNCME
jgi:hypothetical protein